MSEQPAELKLSVGCISDRGLSEKRPLNEDSFLADPERRIFAVADGVGGADSGEVASQTAVEVLDDAFQHHTEGDDAEDLMEIAIQRANQSIHQMAREHSKLSMMATTLVALYIDNDRATIGHVGDSRLYRLTPDGRLHRETADHSVVEEEVRAGRMTPEQAAHHPSRNVISRALGAEASVEADMKMIEIEPGTTFLLCSDGITRHIPDDEIEQILSRASDLDAACEEMKRICYERGAEDNLTAVIVRVGDFDLHRTIPTLEIEEEDDGARTMPSAARPTLAATAPLPAAAADSSENSNGETISGETGTVEQHRPAASIPQPTVAAAPGAPSPAGGRVGITPRPAPSRRKVFGAAVLSILLPLVILGASALAFYGGTLWQRRSTVRMANDGATNSPATSNAPASLSEDSLSSFERQRREVDRAPTEWLRRHSAPPGDSAAPEYLHLYGRAQMLSGQHDNALTTLRRALDVMDRDRGTYPDRDPLRVETRITMAAAAMMSANQQTRDGARQQLEPAIETQATMYDPLSPPKPPDTTLSPPQPSPDQ